MPILIPGARGLLEGQWLYHSLHTESPADASNEVQIADYARVEAAWTAVDGVFKPQPFNFGTVEDCLGNDKGSRRMGWRRSNSLPDGLCHVR